MSGAKETRSGAKKPGSEPRRVLKPGGNRARAPSPLENARKKDVAKKEASLDVSADGSCSSDSSCGRASVRSGRAAGVRKKKDGVRNGEVVGKGIDVSTLLPPLVLVTVAERRRCAWITPNSEPLYVSFHDEEWGIPVHNDQKLFELLILSQALAELSWPVILSNRDFFRKLFDNYDPYSIAKFDEKKILSLKSGGNTLISEQKLRAVVENARQMLKVIEELGSFSFYWWKFVNQKPIMNGFRYARQVPIKTPKSEAISKDLVRRGFRCVGPTTIYSFMQAAGLVNDHLACCFRYQDCIYWQTKHCKTSIEESMTLATRLEKACSLQA